MPNEGDNQLARGEMGVGGQRLSLQDVKSDAYVVGAVNDHIMPWQASASPGSRRQQVPGEAPGDYIHD